MPKRIKFGPFVPDERRAAIASGLVPLADAGLKVSVDLGEGDSPLDLWIRIDEPGRHSVFRSLARTPSEWASFVGWVLNPRASN